MFIKEDIKLTIKEMIRVLKKGSLLYLNLLFIEEFSPGSFCQKENEYDIVYTFFGNYEGDSYFCDFEILYKKIRKEYLKKVDYSTYEMIDYIVKK